MDAAKQTQIIKELIAIKHPSQRMMEKHALNVSVRCVYAFQEWAHMINSKFHMSRQNHEYENIEQAAREVWKDKDLIKRMQRELQLDGMEYQMEEAMVIDILKGVSSMNHEVHQLQFVTQYDKENCYNRMKRQISLKTCSKLMPATYLANYATTSCPTKIILPTKERDIFMMNDGHLQGRGPSTNTLMLNEIEIQSKVKVGCAMLLQILNLNPYKFNLETAYADDNNTGGTLAQLNIKKQLTAYYQAEYGDKYKISNENILYL
eukprot:172378_1